MTTDRPILSLALVGLGGLMIVGGCSIAAVSALVDGQNSSLICLLGLFVSVIGLILWVSSLLQED